MEVVTVIELNRFEAQLPNLLILLQPWMT